MADGQAQGGTSRRGGKSDAAFRTISEVATELDVPQHVLRFWETKFSHIRPMKRGGGRRYYRPEDVVLLTTIRDLLYREGYTIKGVQKLLRDNGAKAVVNALQDRAEDDAGALTLVGMAAAAHDDGLVSGGPVIGDAASGLGEVGDDVSDDGDAGATPSVVDGPEAATPDEPWVDGIAAARVAEAPGVDDGAAMRTEPVASGARGPAGLDPAHRQELESILEDLVALRSLMGQALNATRPPSMPLDG
ncbi:MerR family transcriptional regulator [Roseospira visakhapatnamensis]|uniref:DNA-binding transcriptional MerR regulator n=1 Tax=Roseospira visakhapatnamensis TaxID=390880 RepID=A0A7W6REC9_9PROT|nr:MerR family transcriptional regulator [Roseospira visakhapatnamensis]MBB4266995.1 DNA-binding transcriptional MerR regulator [Roseospira visakhapatnamensis]